MGRWGDQLWPLGSSLPPPLPLLPPPLVPPQVSGTQVPLAAGVPPAAVQASAVRVSHSTTSVTDGTQHAISSAGGGVVLQGS